MEGEQKIDRVRERRGGGQRREGELGSVVGELIDDNREHLAGTESLARQTHTLVLLHM